MLYARIEADQVVEIIDLPADVAPAAIYPPQLLDQIHPAAADVRQGWSLQNGVLVAPVSQAPDPAEQARLALIAYAADKRWRVEVGGISVGGIDVATDDRSKLMLMGARIKADTDPAFSTRWKSQAGFAVLGATEILAVSDAVLAHVDACFAAEASVLAAIDAGSITTTAEIDAAEWPGV